MTSDTTGTQWVPRPMRQPSAHAFQQPARPLLRHPLTSGIQQPPSMSDAEPAFKKQKLDHTPVPRPEFFASQVQHTTLTTGQDPQSQLPFSSNEPNLSDSDPSSITRQTSSSAPSLFFPLRPSSDQRQTPRRCLTTPSQWTFSKLGATQVKPFVPEIPSPAPRYPPSGGSSKVKDLKTLGSAQSPDSEDAADFSPWRGNHQEDVLSESSTKNGFYDKIQVSQTESSTGRPYVWSSLKHRSGLQVLSSLFVSVLDQRQAHGTVTASCTFKPPPRVTLTDSKREAWLQDLANPAIPLRRLSRTIPHGIRGRTLLDHSLAKNIPIARSLWLAKCVGANEIRAFKRKGASGVFAVGGETKWIKEWTANVEQFLDAIIGTCGSPGWKGHIAYGLRLTTSLLAESLLDRDHYLDWLLNATNQTVLDALSIYLLVLRSHLEELGKSRHYGRRLVESVLGQLRKIQCQPSPDLYKPVKLEIEDLIKIFIISSPASFLLPTAWQRYEPMLRFIVGPPNTALYIRFEDICKRNARLEALSDSGQESETPPTQTIVRILDSLSSDSDMTRVALNICKVAHDTDCSVRACLQWSSSVYRGGQARVYVAVRLLQKWCAMGIDIEKHILNFIATESNADGLNKLRFYRVIAELIRSRHFSAGKYFQWVIANGVLGKYGKSSKAYNLDLGLMFEIPLHGLPTHIFNLRQNLLRSIGMSIDDEDQAIAQRKAFIASKLPNQHWHCGNPSELDRPPSDHFRDTLTIKSDVAHWVRQQLMTYSVSNQGGLQQIPPTAVSESKLLSNPSIEMAQFQTLFGILEELEDFTAMFVFLARHTKSHNIQVLAAAAVTVSHYLDVFLAIGAVDILFMQIVEQYKSLDDRLSHTSLIEALIDLGQMLPNRTSETQALQKDMGKSESKLGVAACSPVSEHMAEALQSENTGSTSTDDIEQLLASGTSMDERLLTNVFELIWKRFETTWADSIKSSVASASLISRLRLFNMAAVNQMMILAVDRMLASRPRAKLTRICIPLICARAISLEKLLSRVWQLLHGSDSLFADSELLVEAIELLCTDRPKAESSISYLHYRFYTQQQRVIRDPSSDTVSLLQCLLKHAATTQKQPKITGHRLLLDHNFMTLLRTFSDSSGQGWQRLKVVFEPVLTSEEPMRTMEDLVFPAKLDTTLWSLSQGSNIDLGRVEQEQISEHGKLRGVLMHVNFLNVLLCRLYLQTLLICSSTTSEKAAEHLVSVAVDMAPHASTEKVHLWARMLRGLPPEQKESIRDKAEIKFFTLLASTSETTGPHLPGLLECLLLLMKGADKDGYTAVSASRTLVQIYDSIIRLLVIPSPSGERLEMRLGSMLFFDFFAFINPPSLHRTFPSSTQRPALQTFPIRRWEAMPDATPHMTENDTSISLTLFAARKKVL
ncbi:MAG: hypothetical protein Q9201_006054 [Fulgogasparrea decipioides]